MSGKCSCDWVTGECQGPIGCQAVTEIVSVKQQFVEALRPFVNSLEAFKNLPDETVITNSALSRSKTMPNHYLTVRDLRQLQAAIQSSGLARTASMPHD